jgi:hypothetical protein
LSKNFDPVGLADKNSSGLIQMSHMVGDRFHNFHARDAEMKVTNNMAVFACFLSPINLTTVLYPV